MRVNGCGRVKAVVGVVMGGCVFGLGAPAGAMASPGCTTVQRTVTCAFDYTGTEQSFAVPAGVSSLQVYAVGASGGGSHPGGGGTADAIVAVTPGQTLYVEVGGTGRSTTGGFNGGGAPGATPGTSPAGAGGGASDVRTSSCGVSCPGAAISLASRLVVAAGGGGSGGLGLHAGALAPGGSAEADGADGRPDSAGDGGGGGGRAGSNGGMQGAAGTAASGGTPGAAGSGGVAGQGGDGGPGGTVSAAGGGGGGGVVGGGGGGSGGESIGNQAGGGGGGGGSSLASGGSTGVATSAGPGSVTITYTLPDTTAPAISISTPRGGGIYALGAAVGAAYSCADEAGGSGLASCGGPVPAGSAIDTSTVGQHTFAVTASDNAGNVGSQTVSYVVSGPPSASVTAPASGHLYARGQKVQTRFTCAEGPFGPGLAQCQDSNGVGASAGLSPTKSATGQLNTLTPGPHTYAVTAGSADGLGARSQIGYTVAAPPTITIGSPAKGKAYPLGQSVSALYTCKDGAYGPGIKSCKGTVPNKSKLSTLTAGQEKFTVTAISKDGQRATRTITYKVSAALIPGSNRLGSVVAASGYSLELSGGQHLNFAKLVAFRNSGQTCTAHQIIRSCAGKGVTVILRGSINDTALVAWRKAAKTTPQQAPATVTLKILSASGNAATEIMLKNAYPSKLTTSSLKAGNSSPTIVTVTIRATAAEYEGTQGGSG